MSARHPIHGKSQRRKNQTASHRINLANERKSAGTTAADLGHAFEKILKASRVTKESSFDESFSSSEDDAEQSPEEKINMLYEFYEGETRNELLDIKPTMVVELTSEIKCEIGLENGTKNLPYTPLKQLHKSVIQVYFPEVAKRFKSIQLFLVRYPLSNSKKGEKFLVLDSASKANRAVELISRLEAFHRRNVRFGYDRTK